MNSGLECKKETGPSITLELMCCAAPPAQGRTTLPSSMAPQHLLMLIPGLDYWRLLLSLDLIRQPTSAFLRAHTWYIFSGVGLESWSIYRIVSMPLFKRGILQSDTSWFWSPIYLYTLFTAESLSSFANEGEDG